MRLKSICSLAFLMMWLVQSAYALAPMPEMLNREEMLKQASEVTREMAPDARTFGFAQARYVEYAPDGSSTLWIEWWIKAFTEGGAQELHEIPLWYKKGFSESEFQVAEVIRADGTVVPVDLKANVKDVSSNDGNDVNIYDENSRQVVLTIPQIQKDETLHFVMVQHTMRPRIPDAYMDFDTFESMESPLPYAKLTIVAPKELPLKSMAVLDEVPGTIKVSQETLSNGGIKYCWEARNVPQTFPEENMPDEVTQLQRVVVSTFATWEELSKWYWDLCAPHMKVTPAITAKVKELTEGKSREDQIAALFGFVAQEIRYMGIIAEDTAPGYEPHDVSLTFDNRYGVCRDKGALLVAMLREAGFNAFPVLINAGSQRDREVPIPYFNHAVIAIDEGERNYRLMDPTDDTARAELPAYLSDCTYLVTRPEGETLLVTPVPNPADHTTTVKTDAVLDKSGNLELSSTLRFDGINDNVYRSVFVKSTPEVLRERMDGMVKRVLPGAELTGISYTPENPKDITQPLVLTLTARVADYAVPNNEGHTLVKLPYFSRVFGMVNFLFEGLEQPERKYDWVISSPCAVRETLTLRGFNSLGEAQVLPQDPILKSNGASYDVICKLDKAADTITLTRELELSQKTYTPENYRALRRFRERMSRFEDLRPLFVQNTTANEDATMVSDISRTTLNEDGSTSYHYTRKVRVNTFQGKRSQGEMKLWYAPDWQTLTLNVAEVTTAKGDCIPVTPKEINELDSDSAAGAPRYAAWKQKVISLPAIEVGSVSHLDWVITSKDNLPFCETKIFDCEYSTEEETYSLTVPLAEVPNMRIAERNFENVDVERTEEIITEGEGPTAKQKKVYTWTLRNRPAVKAEPSTPSAELFSPVIYVAHRNAAAHRLMPDLIEKIEEVLDEDYPVTEDTVEALIENIDDDDTDALLKAIQEFMARRIRQAGPSWSALVYGTLSNPDTTLAAGYGNRLDRLILWLAMLREADIDAEIVFADQHTLAYDYAFNTRIAAREVPRWTRWATPYIRLEDGRLIGDGADCDEVAVTRLTSRAVMTEKGRELYTADEANRSRQESKLRLTVDAGGDATISSETLAYGLAAGQIRRTVRESTPETRKRALAAAAEALAIGAEPISDYKIETETYPVKASLTVAAKHYAIRQGAILSIPLPRMVSPVYSMRGTRRSNPIWQDEVTAVNNELKVILPKGSQLVSRPEPFKVVLPGGGACELTLKDEFIETTGERCLTYTTKINSAPAVLDAWLFPACVELNRRLIAPEMQTIVVRLPE